MNKEELAQKILELIKDEVPVSPEVGITYDPTNFNPVINIMESKDDPRKRFHIEIVDVTELNQNKDE